MTTARPDATDAMTLRDSMIRTIRDAGYTLSPRVEHALRTVERHIFASDVSLEEAYANDIVVTKRDAAGQVLSCLSQPSIVALQLEQLGVQPGDRVLEIGAGSGYNAALLGRLAGPAGHVTAVDVDADIVEQARDRLAEAGVRNVEVVLGDGALGYPPEAPFDRIIATVGVYGLPESLLAQLAPGGRLVVPMRIRGGVSRSIAFERGPEGALYSVDHQMCGFVPLRNGAADDPRRTAALTTDDAVTVRLNQEHCIDPAGLVGVLARSRYEAWTGVLFGPGASLEWMYLWLACTLDTGVCSMSVDQKAIDAGLITPMFRSSTMAVPGEQELAYLTWRVTDRTDDGKTVEIGVIGHSDKGAGLCERVAAEIAFWDQQYRHRSADFGIASVGANDRTIGTFFLERSHHHGLAVRWR